VARAENGKDDGMVAASMQDKDAIASCHPNWQDFIVAVGLRLRELEAIGLYGEPTACRDMLVEMGKRFDMTLPEAAHALRVVITGRAIGFCLYKTLEILGMDEVGKRIVYAVTWGSSWASANDGCRQHQA